ncbi:similar to Saccharomyces cerevisiae YGL252C RTG2 Sensor of mitochondrial dysfunction [Maudiozyma saulgeensis]|uniref:Similar to Saccharomyces cerevisiae YGL252C RTG2 Sensor of mitochondrial dysfunction n=1 Tax=Maudiozyma saulgeensis TaxID=1789683 RepID=A0A1X7RAY1_9SACH|nr:similar to Saccharomyces cerevisiae YGL252C RTG2 Sensor of mitochondrial dysfunction [Kazachstania saulgeensis]
MESSATNNISAVDIESQFTESENISRNLCGLVDMGSNGIRFSISSISSHHARITPCVFKDRIGISLYEIQFPHADSLEQIPIPTDIITEICSAIKRFKLICEDFGVPDKNVKIIATEATRIALNRDELLKEIEKGTNWEIKVLSQEEEGTMTTLGLLASSADNETNGIYFDLLSGSCQISWIKTLPNGEFMKSEKVSFLPYGSGTITRLVKAIDDNDASKLKLFDDLKADFMQAIQDIQIPNDMMKEAIENDGFKLITRGGGLRGMGHLLINQDKDYPIQTIINGFCTSSKNFQSISDYLFLKGKIPNFDNSCHKIKKFFKISEKRSIQLPAVGLLTSALLESLPKVKSIYFSEGGIREGFLYTQLPESIHKQDPIIVASKPYAPLLSNNYLKLLLSAVPRNPQTGEYPIPEIVWKRVAPTLCNLAFIHASYPKELQPTAALHVAITGILSGCNGLSHEMRALIGIALCYRWGGNIPETEERFLESMENVILNQYDESSRINSRVAKRIIWWTKYIGTFMYVICGVHPGGNIRDNLFKFHVIPRAISTREHQSNNIDEELDRDQHSASRSDRTDYEAIVSISKDDLKTSASVRARIITLQKRIKKLSRGNIERVKVTVQMFE